MQSAILAKLKSKLSVPPPDEADVVYILVEIRKYLDHTDPKRTSYAVLGTYCDWPVHIILSRKGARDILRALGDAYADSLTDEGRDKAMLAIFKRFSLYEFEKELRRFLQSTGLPLNLLDEPGQWAQFLQHYVSVVSDCPFAFGGRPRHPKDIVKATLKINETLEKAPKGWVNVGWFWLIEFADGTSKHVSHTRTAVYSAGDVKAGLRVLKSEATVETP
jgi:hypothetical protein